MVEPGVGEEEMNYEFVRNGDPCVEGRRLNLLIPDEEWPAWLAEWEGAGSSLRSRLRAPVCR